ncbi:MAG: ABC-2 family transporter protein [Spirochaetaceae bacterium]|nr:ABC-2 family transporter protein [Spirochaetaceae bacterium]MDE0447410.1 ABC-2 family transporter protein [Spirochaetaceae bacterium]
MAADRRRNAAAPPTGAARRYRTLRLLARYFRVNLAANTAYPVPFAIQVVAMAANNAMFLAFWAILFEAIDAPIAGYTFTDVMFLWAVAAAGFGLGAVVCGNSGHLSRIIYRGDLDVYLAQPKPVLPNLLASRMSVSSWGDLLYGLGLFAVSQPLTGASIGLFLLFVLLAAGVLVAVRVLYHSLTFLLGNAEDLAGVGSEQIITFSLYPGTIFDGPLVAVILHTLIPAALVAHLPADLFRAVVRGTGMDWGLLAIIVAGDAALIAAAWALFALGLRRYESGNRIGARI